jgi:hypothetical protein
MKKLKLEMLGDSRDQLYNVVCGEDEAQIYVPCFLSTCLKIQNVSAIRFSENM